MKIYNPDKAAKERMIRNELYRLHELIEESDPVSANAIIFEIKKDFGFSDYYIDENGKLQFGWTHCGHIKSVRK